MAKLKFVKDKEGNWDVIKGSRTIGFIFKEIWGEWVFCPQNELRTMGSEFLRKGSKMFDVFFSDKTEPLQVAKKMDTLNKSYKEKRLEKIIADEESTAYLPGDADYFRAEYEAERMTKAQLNKQLKAIKEYEDTKK